MKLLLTLLILVGNSFASGNHQHENHKKEPIKVYEGYVLNTASKKAANAVYHCTCEDRDWKQDASKKKACPYCGPAMSECGYLVKVEPDRKTEYSWDEYDLPNKVCPVTGELIESQKHFIETDGQKIYVCCKKCASKLQKSFESGKSNRYLRKLPLKPEKFGFTKATEAETSDQNEHKDHEH